MLIRKQIEQIAENYLIKNDYPIVIASGSVTLPEDGNDKYGVLEENGVAEVCFQSKYLDDPEHFSVPALFIVYVDLLTGEVHMPRHMV